MSSGDSNMLSHMDNQIKSRESSVTPMRTRFLESKACGSTVSVSEELELAGARSSNALADTVFSRPFSMSAVVCDCDCVSLPQLLIENIDVPLLEFPVALLSLGALLCLFLQVHSIPGINNDVTAKGKGALEL